MNLLACVALCVLAVDARKNVYEYRMDDVKDYIQIYNRKHDESLYSGQKLKAFSWKDCSTGSPMLNIQALSILPDPLSFPGPMDVTTNFNIKKTFGKPLKAEVKLYKKTFSTYIEIPCIDGFGSCTYDSVCDMLAPIQSQCPDPVKKIGIDCACPFKAGSYSLPKTEFDINASIIPSGEYHIIVNATTSGAEVACADIYLEVS